MLVKTFWNIVIKIIGLFLLLDCLSILPQFFSTLSFTNGNLDIEDLILVWLMLLGIIVLYFLFIGIFLFKTDWIIEKLRLENNFTEQKIDINIKSSTILNIAIIIIGALILIESVPNFCLNLFNFFKQKNLLYQYSETSWLIYYFVKIILGYFLLANGKIITNFIEKKLINNQTE